MENTSAIKRDRGRLFRHLCENGKRLLFLVRKMFFCASTSWLYLVTAAVIDRESRRSDRGRDWPYGCEFSEGAVLLLCLC